MPFALVFLLSNRHSALDSTHDLFRTEYPVDSLKLFGIRIPLVAGSSPLSVKTLLFLICFALSRYSFKNQIIRYWYAYNTGLFVTQWLISKSLEINAAIFWKLKEKRLGLRSFANVIKIFDNRKIEGANSFCTLYYSQGSYFIINEMLWVFIYFSGKSYSLFIVSY